mmetsp:Transcript_3110/g.4796  ORF Transcript_3110/g.4796 Transcript_3110/m.4796 type:complete len:98 (+) Transcript_3110:406-699(+)
MSADTTSVARAVLEEGSVADPSVPNKDRMLNKYYVSITYDEVNHGLLCNRNAREQAIYVERCIDKIDSAHEVGQSEVQRCREATPPTPSEPHLFTRR